MQRKLFAPTDRRLLSDVVDLEIVTRVRTYTSIRLHAYTHAHLLSSLRRAHSAVCPAQRRPALQIYMVLTRTIITR